MGKENPRGTTDLPPAFCVTLDEPLPDLAPGQPAAAGNVTVMEKGEKLTTTSTQISADGIHTCSAQAVIPTQSHLQNQVGGAL